MFVNRKSKIKIGLGTSLVAAVVATSMSNCLLAQTVANASFETPTVASNAESFRPAGASWTFSGQSGIRNNASPNGGDGKQVAFLTAAPASGNNNFGALTQNVSFAPGLYYVRYAAAVKTPTGRPQPLKFSFNGATVGGVLSPRYITDATTGGFESGWTQPFVVSTAGSYTLRFEATNATNYGTAGAPQYAVAYLDSISIVNAVGSFSNPGFENATAWTLSTGATRTTPTNAPEGTAVLSLASAATASQTLSLTAGRYSVSLKSGKSSATAALIRVEVASNGGAATTVANITPTTADEFRSYSTPGFSLPAGTHVLTLRAVSGSMLLDNIALNEASAEPLNSTFETPSLAAPTSATAAGPTRTNPTNAQWAFGGTGGQIQGNAGASNTSAPRTIYGKQYLALSSTGKVSQSLTFEGGVYIAIAQIAQGGATVAIDGVNLGKLSASTLDFREVVSLPFVIAAGTRSVSLAVDSTYSPATPKIDEFRLQRIDLPPAVSITAPANGAIFQTGAMVNITASASDADGLASLTVSRIPNGGSESQLATSAASPLSTSWSNASANTYTVKAIATDATGTQNSTSISVRVNANPNAIFSINPSGPVVTSTAAVSVTATVSSVGDSDGTVTKVEFLQDGVVSASCTKSIPPAVAPFTCAHSLAPKATPYALAVRITDNDGGITTTAPLTIKINTAPTVSVDAACVAPCTANATVNLTATPVDSDGNVAKVEFYDGSTLLTTKTASPWTHSHTNAAAGSHSYTAKAYDNDGTSTTSAAKSVSVTAATPTIALSAACTAPCNAPATVTLTATPSNITGTIAKVEFYDGATLLNTDTASPFSFAASSVAAATHSYTAKVYVTGTATAVATSAAQSVRVNALPSVSLTAECVAPCANPATVNLTASATDADGTINKVEFYDGATLRGTATVSPWTYTHANAATGIHNYTAKAFDNDNATKTSSAVSVTVVATPAPSVQLTAVCDTPCEAPASVLLTAKPVSISGASYVSFYDGSTYLDVGNVQPDANGSFVARKTFQSTGAHAIKAIVGVSSNGNQYESNVVNVTVAAPSNYPPTVSWVWPGDGAQINAFGKFILKVDASDQDGSIADVKFYADGNLIGNGALQGGSYLLEWTPPSGLNSYQITATATDNLGKTVTTPSNRVSVVDTIQFAPPTTTTFFTDVATNLATVRFPVEVTPNPVLWQGPFYTWNGETRFILWNVELLENGVVVDTKKYGYEVIPYSIAECSYYFVGQNSNCIALRSAPVMEATARPLGSASYAVRVSPRPGAIWQSAPVTMTVVDPRPIVSVASTSGQSAIYEGAVFVTVSAGAYPGYAVSLYEADQFIGSCRITGSTCTYLWASATAGAHTVTAKVTTSSGEVVASAPVSFNVLANAKPSVSIVAPAYLADFRAPATVQVRASATDADGAITKVEFFDSSDQLLGAGALNGGFYTFTMPEANPASVNQSVRVGVRAVDNRGAPSDLVTVDYVVHAPAYVYFDAPCLNMTCYTSGLVLGYDTNQNSYITRVRYLRNGVEITPTNVYRLGKVDASVSAGIHVYRVEITTSYGDTILSEPVTVTVVQNDLPTVAITSPANNAVLYNMFSLPLSATATDPDGTIKEVNFYVGEENLGWGALSSGVYSRTWSPPYEGDLTLTARATDDRNGVSASAPVKIKVNRGPRPVAISVVDGMVAVAGQAITITVGGAGSDPAVSRVELFATPGGLLASVTGNSLTYTLTPASGVTSIELDAQSYNARGGRTLSERVRLSVLPAGADSEPYAAWINLTAALKAGNKALALGYITPSAQETYAAVFDAMISQGASFAASLIPGVIALSKSAREVEYLVARSVDGNRYLFSVRLLKMDDGTWKIESL